MSYILHAESGTHADYSVQDITKWIDPRAQKGNTVYDYRTGNTYKVT